MKVTKKATKKWVTMTKAYFRNIADNTMSPTHAVGQDINDSWITTKVKSTFLL